MSPTVAGTSLTAALDDDREETFLLSDLHVNRDRSPVLDDLGLLLARAAKVGARGRVLILGDLFDHYVGCGQLALGAWKELASMLRETAEAGVSLTVLPGNRDFLLDPGFAARTGCRLVSGGLRLRLNGQSVLALHGDELCLRDHPYQRSRGLLRHPTVRTLMGHMPVSVALCLARAVRRRSRQTTVRGDQDRFQPTAWAVRGAFAAGAEVLVFGHIHAWSRGQIEGGGECCVLPAFDKGGIHLHHAQEGLRFCNRQGEPVADPPPACFR